MDIITNKPVTGPKWDIFSDNNFTGKFSFPDGYDLSGLTVKINKRLDNSVISDLSKQPVLSITGQILYITFSVEKLKLLSSPFTLYIYDGNAAIIGCECIVSNKSGSYSDITTQVVIGDETIVEVNAQLNPASVWGSIDGDIANQTDLIALLSNGLTEDAANLLYAPIVHTHTFASLTARPTTLTGYGILDAYTKSQIDGFGYLTNISSTQVTNALGYTPVSLSGSYSDPSWLTLSKSKVGLSNVLNLVQEPAITAGTTSQYWRGDKTWQTFPTIPTNNNQLTNGNNYITAGSTDTLTNKSGNISQWTNNSGYLTAITSSQINTALGYTPYNGATNPNNYVTSSALTGYATQSFVTSGYSPIGHTHTFASLTSIPTTIAGYGITDAYTKTQIDSANYTTASNTQTFTNKSGNISQWANDSSYITSVTSSQVTTALGYTPVNPNGTNLQYIAGDGSKITFPTIPTNTNQLTNGSGYITASSTNTLTNKSISYDQLTGTPTIPTNANYVDLTTAQTVAGSKTFTSITSFSADQLPTTNNTLNLGSSTFKWSGMYALAAVITNIKAANSNGVVFQSSAGVGTGKIFDNANWIIQNGGTITDNLAGLQLKNTITASTAIARGAYMTSTLNASANNDVLVGWDINATYNKGAFTGVADIALRTNSDIENTKINGSLILRDTATSARSFIRITNGAIVVSTS